jgi:hypothetical protein
MELYGLRLHLLCSFTGGFIVHCNDKWPNIIKCSTFAVLFSYFYLILAVDFPLFVRVLLGLLLAIMILILELIIIWLNSLLDDSVSVDVDEDHTDEREISPIPLGISRPLWDARSVLFEERIPLDNRAYRLVRRGFDVDEVFRLIELIHQGVVTKDTRSLPSVRRVKTNLIIVCGKPINIHFDRDSLSRTFSRPMSNWHVFSATLLTFMLALFTTETRPLNSHAWVWYLSLICASAIFSLLLPPPTDPYSTSLCDPFLSYTRAASAVGMTGVVALMHLLASYVPETIYIEQLQLTMQ